MTDTPKTGSRNRIQFDDDGSLDEVVTDGGAHLEHLGEKQWFLSMSRADGSSFAVWFKGKIIMTEEREPSAFRAAQSHVPEFKTTRQAEPALGVMSDDLCPTCDGKGVVPKGVETGVMSDDRTRPLLLAQAATRGADDWRDEDAEAVIAQLLAKLDRQPDTRESIRAQLQANEEAAVAEFRATNSVRAALAKHREGV